MRFWYKKTLLWQRFFFQSYSGFLRRQITNNPLFIIFDISFGHKIKIMIVLSGMQMK